MKYEIHADDQGFRKGILFLSGKGKSLNNFNITSTGKNISLETQFRKRVQTCLVEFDETDLENRELVMKKLTELIDPKLKWYVVAHSLGCSFAIELESITAMILVDPSKLTLGKEIRIPVHVHVRLSRESFDVLDRITGYNANSAIILHCKASHMIHWDEPGKIASSINSLLK